MGESVHGVGHGRKKYQASFLGHWPSRWFRGCGLLQRLERHLLVDTALPTPFGTEILPHHDIIQGNEEGVTWSCFVKKEERFWRSGVKAGQK